MFIKIMLHYAIGTRTTDINRRTNIIYSYVQYGTVLSFWACLSQDRQKKWKEFFFGAYNLKDENKS